MPTTQALNYQQIESSLSQLFWCAYQVTDRGVDPSRVPYLDTPERKEWARVHAEQFLGLPEGHPWRADFEKRYERTQVREWMHALGIQVTPTP